LGASLSPGTEKPIPLKSSPHFALKKISLNLLLENASSLFSGNTEASFKLKYVVKGTKINSETDTKTLNWLKQQIKLRLSGKKGCFNMMIPDSTLMLPIEWQEHWT
jgi:hypothetical protein